MRYRYIYILREREGERPRASNWVMAGRFREWSILPCGMGMGREIVNKAG